MRADDGIANPRAEYPQRAWAWVGTVGVGTPARGAVETQNVVVPDLAPVDSLRFSHFGDTRRPGCCGWSGEQQLH